MTQAGFESLDDEQYISLTTFRKSGKAVPTPVWFAREGDTLYVTTADHSGKVKRLRHTAEVTMAACDARGNVHGDTLEGAATIHAETSETGKHANRLLNQKYGLFKRLFDLMGMFSRQDRVFLEIKPR